jgi:ATP-dependent Clp protease ATP-binding subunit ClpA
MHLDAMDRRALAALDLERATELFAKQVAETPTSQCFEGSSSAYSRSVNKADRFILPLDLVPSEDLTYQARISSSQAEYPFDRVPKYDRMFDAICRVLHRRNANHVLLTGERGVGKTTIILELARRAASGQIPFLRSKRFLWVDCRYVPPDESRQRLLGILAQLASKTDLIACVNGFCSLLRSERPGGNKAVLLAGLAQASCQVIGLVTPREVDEFFSDDPDWAELFTRVEVDEPDIDVAIKLVRHLARGLEEKYQVGIDDETVREAVVLSANYILNDQLPGKALTIINHVCQNFNYDRYLQNKPDHRVTTNDVIHVVSDLSGVPEETLHGISERSDYEQSLREFIFGQDHAVHEVATELSLIKAGMVDLNKPASVMLFLGQTGTGKTELAKILARFYSTSKRLKTYTLGNCVEPHSVATIIGVPPGYVGHDQGGRLVNELNSDAYSVFLLDEADKAHPDVLQPFLNLFDEGWVCDQRGVRGYANKSIFILTSNVGQRMIAEMVRTGKSRDEITVRMKEALSQIRHSKSDRPVFTPEFLSRIKRIIVFNPLDQEALLGISRKLVAEIQREWFMKRGKHLEVPEELVVHVGKEAQRLNERSEGKEGGRIVRKLISEWVEARIQSEITQRTDEYRKCGVVALEFVPLEAQPISDQSAPSVIVKFLQHKS